MPLGGDRAAQLRQPRSRIGGQRAFAGLRKSQVRFVGRSRRCALQALLHAALVIAQRRKVAEARHVVEEDRRRLALPLDQRIELRIRFGKRIEHQIRTSEHEVTEPGVRQLLGLARQIDRWTALALRQRDLGANQFAVGLKIRFERPSSDSAIFCASARRPARASSKPAADRTMLSEVVAASCASRAAAAALPRARCISPRATRFPAARTRFLLAGRRRYPRRGSQSHPQNGLPAPRRRPARTTPRRRRRPTPWPAPHRS